MQAAGRFFQSFSKLSIFPLPGQSKFAITYTTPEVLFAKNAVVGFAIGMVFGGAFRFWHKQIYNVRRDDFYKQLEIANREEREKRAKDPSYEPTYQIWSRDDL